MVDTCYKKGSMKILIQIISKDDAMIEYTIIIEADTVDIGFRAFNYSNGCVKIISSKIKPLNTNIST
jgi:hypothetical protein